MKVCRKLEGDKMDNGTKDAVKLFVELLIIFAALYFIPILLTGG